MLNDLVDVDFLAFSGYGLLISYSTQFCCRIFFRQNRKVLSVLSIWFFYPYFIIIYYCHYFKTSGKIILIGHLNIVTFSFNRKLLLDYFIIYPFHF